MVLADPAMTARFDDLAATAMLMTAAEFGNYMAAETEKWRRVVRTAGIKPE